LADQRDSDIHGSKFALEAIHMKPLAIAWRTVEKVRRLWLFHCRKSRDELEQNQFATKLVYLAYGAA
jgi:hypothetical protein